MGYRSNRGLGLFIDIKMPGPPDNGVGTFAQVAASSAETPRDITNAVSCTDRRLAGLTFGFIGEAVA
jgi:hypothetical protein